jgi:hypothetical protein
MDNTLVYVMMIVIGFLMAVWPFAIFMGLTTLLGLPTDDTRILVTFILLVCVLAYGTALGAFALIQRNSCGEVKNMRQVASNAAMSLAIQAISVVTVTFIPGLRRIVTNLFPPDMSPAISNAIGYSYYGFWASVFGTAIGGTLSGVCS